MNFLERKYTTALAVFCGFIFMSICVSAQTPKPLPLFPAPEKTFQSDKQFNAVTIGPGNTFTVRKTPPDFSLDSFDFSADGKQLFMLWGSGRLEIRDLETTKRVTEFKPMSGPVFEVETDNSTKTLVIVGQHGVLRFINPQTGKMTGEIHTEIGRLKYDIQKVLVAPDGSWLAYANQENGKVLDLKSDPAKVLADLGDAYDLALTPDSSQLWVVNREKIFGLTVPQWTQIKSAPLIDQVALTNTPSLTVVSGEGGPIAFIPSKTGLLRYELATLTGIRVTDKPAYVVLSSGARNAVIVNQFKALSAFGANGAQFCEWQQLTSQGSNGLKTSENGEWFGVLNSGKVEVWATKSLLTSCAK